MLLFAFPVPGAEQVLRLSGTGSALATLRRMSGPFERANPGHRLHVFASVGSTGAIAAVANGALEIGISGRPLEPAEEALGLTGIPYARTPFLFAAGPRSGASGTTAGEIVRIYRGEATTWPNGERIRVVIRPRTDVDTSLLRAISPEMSKAVDASYAREGQLVAVTNQECDEILSRTPGSIGPTTLTEILTEGSSAVPLTWNGVAPTVPNLASGAYPLAKTLIAVTRVPHSPAVRRFLAFLASPEARSILEQTGNLPLKMPPLEQLDAQRR